MGNPLHAASRGEPPRAAAAAVAAVQSEVSSKLAQDYLASSIRRASSAGADSRTPAAASGVQCVRNVCCHL